MKLIDKDVLVTEIERRKSQFMSKADSFHKLGMEETRDHYAALASNIHSVLSFLDTLEVKEVDFEKENIIGTLERVVKIDAGGYPYIDCDIEFYDYDKDIPLAKEGDKVKVIVVKGE